jgi:hypothetical protein
MLNPPSPPASLLSQNTINKIIGFVSDSLTPAEGPIKIAQGTAHAEGIFENIKGRETHLSIDTSPSGASVISAKTEIPFPSPLAQSINDASPLILFFDRLHLSYLPQPFKEFIYPQRNLCMPFILPKPLGDPSLSQWAEADTDNRKKWVTAFVQDKFTKPKELQLIIKVGEKNINSVQPNLSAFNARFKVTFIMYYGREALPPEIVLQEIQQIIQPAHLVSAAGAAAAGP